MTGDEGESSRGGSLKEWKVSVRVGCESNVKEKKKECLFTVYTSSSNNPSCRIKTASGMLHVHWLLLGPIDTIMRSNRETCTFNALQTRYAA